MYKVLVFFYDINRIFAGEPNEVLMTIQALLVIEGRLLLTLRELIEVSIKRQDKRVWLTIIYWLKNIQSCACNWI